MIVTFLKFIDPLVLILFRLHDILCDFLAQYFVWIKKLLLFVAFLSLIFILFPEMRKDFGSYAEGMLLGILFLSPLSKIFRMRLLSQLMGLRREFGILMGCFALVHGVAYFVDPLSFSLDIAPYLNSHFFSMHPLFYFGILALILTLPLLFTSNTVSIRFLGGKNWKRLHRLVYIILITMLFHIFFLKAVGYEYDAVELIQPLFIVLGYILLKILARKNFLPFLQDVITYTGERYDRYAILQKETVS